MAAELLPQTLSLSPLSVLYPAVTTLAVLSVISGGGRGREMESLSAGGDVEAIKGDFDSD